MQNLKCKTCRRLGVKLFLKGEKCFSPKCPIIKKPYPPGQKIKRRERGFSEYGKALKEKQRLRNCYNLGEKQFSNYVKKALQKQGRTKDIGAFLIKSLESRFDNVVFRLGFASSRSQARQLISHEHFLINKKKVDIPSYQLKKGDKIGLTALSVKKEVFLKLKPVLKNHQPPSWLKLDYEKMQAEVIGEPSLEQAQPPAEIPLIFEFYSK